MSVISPLPSRPGDHSSRPTGSLSKADALSVLTGVTPPTASGFPSLKYQLPASSVSPFSGSSYFSSSHSRSGFITSGTVCRGRVGIICKFWPTWLFVLPALHWSYTLVLLTFTPPEWLNIIQELYPAISFQCNWPASCSDPFQDADWVLFHGSLHWMQEHTPLWPHRPMLGSFTRSDASVGAPTDSHLCVSSVTVGSVADGVWHFHVPNDCCALPVPSMYERRLSHILDPATRFPSGCSRPSVSSFPSDGFLSVHQLHHPVKCRSIFSLGRWVIRLLSTSESGRALDLPPHLIRSFSLTYRSALPWLGSPPLKVLHHVSKCLSVKGGGNIGYIR